MKVKLLRGTKSLITHITGWRQVNWVSQHRKIFGRSRFAKAEAENFLTSLEKSSGGLYPARHDGTATLPEDDNQEKSTRIVLAQPILSEARTSKTGINMAGRFLHIL